MVSQEVFALKVIWLLDHLKIEQKLIMRFHILKLVFLDSWFYKGRIPNII